MHRWLNKSYLKRMKLTEDHILILEIVDEYNKIGVACDDDILKKEYLKRRKLLESK